jgi:hypothetical protein
MAKTFVGQAAYTFGEVSDGISMHRLKENELPQKLTAEMLSRSRETIPGRPIGMIVVWRETAGEKMKVCPLYFEHFEGGISTPKRPFDLFVSCDVAKAISDGLEILPGGDYTMTVSKRTEKEMQKVRQENVKRHIYQAGKVIATYTVGEVGEGETAQPFVYNIGGESHIECLMDICTQMGGRPVGYVNVRLKDGKPQYMYTYFFPKHEGCTQAGCTGEIHEPKNAGDVGVMMGAIDYIKKGSNGTGILPVRAEAESNFAAAGK